MLPFWNASRAAWNASSSLRASVRPLAVASAAARQRVASLVVGILVTALSLLSSFSHRWRRSIAKSFVLAGLVGLSQEQPVRRIGGLVPIPIVQLLQEGPEEGF